MEGIAYDEGARKLVCTLAGKMDIVASTALETQLNEKLAELKASDPNHSEISITLDLRRVDFVASVFIRVCVSLSRQFRKGSFSIINTHPKVKQVFIISGLDGLVSII